MLYFSEPVHCAGPDPNTVLDANPNQREFSWLLNKLKFERSMLLLYRREHNIISTDVTLGDLKIKWLVRDSSEIHYRDFHGLGSLADRYPHVLRNTSETKVVDVIDFIESL